MIVAIMLLKFPVSAISMSAPEPPPIYNNEESNRDLVQPELLSASDSDQPAPPNETQQLGGLCLIAAAVLIAFCAFIGLAAWSISGLVNAFDPTPIAQPTYAEKDLRWATIKEAFTNPHCDVDEATKRRLQETIQTIMDLDNEGDIDAVLAMVDKDAFIARMKSTGIYSPRWAEALSIKQQFAEVTSGPSGYAEFHIVSIDALNDNNAVVSMHATDNCNDTYELRWWMTRKKNRWMAYDWEIVMEGITEVEEYAVICDHHETKGIQNFYRANSNFVDGATALSEGKQQEGIRKLERSLASPVDPDLQDCLKLQNGNWLFSYYENEKAKKVLNSISNPKMTPGVWYFLAKCSAEDGDHSQVIHFSDLYLDRVGDSIDMLLLKVDALESLDRTDEAVEFLKTKIESFPDQSKILAKLFHLTPQRQRPELLELVSANETSADEILDLANLTWGPNDWPFLKAAEAKLQTFKVSDAQQAEFEAHNHYSRYQYPETADAWLKACKLSTKAEEKDKFQELYLQVMVDMGQATQGYRNAPNSKAAFQYILDYLFDDIEISSEQAQEIVELHRQQLPNEPMLEYFIGTTLSIEEKNEEAAKAFEQGINRLKKQGGNVSLDADTSIEEILERYQTSLDYERTKFLDPLEAYKKSSDQANTFWTLAAKCDSRWRTQPEERDDAAQVLTALIETEAVNSMPSDMLPFYQSVLLWQMGNKKQAIESQMELVFAFPSESDDDYSVVPRLAKWLHETGLWPDLLPKRLSRYNQARDNDNDNGSILEETDKEDPTKQRILRLMNGLFDRLLQEKNFSAVKQLIEIHRTAGLDDFERKYWSLQLSGSQNDDAAVKRISEMISDQQWADANYDQSYGAEKIIFNSLMRLNEFDQAMRWAQKENQMMPGDIVHVGLAQIAMRDTEGLKDTLKKMTDGNSVWKYQNLLGDPLAVDFIKKEEFRELRNQHPVAIPLYHKDTTVYYLFDSKPSEADLQELLKNQWSDQLEFIQIENQTDAGESETNTKVDHLPLQPDVSFAAHTNNSTVVFSCVQRSLKAYSADQPELSKAPFVVGVTCNALKDAQFDFDKLKAGMFKLGCRAFFRNDESEFVTFDPDGERDEDGTPTTQSETSLYLYLPASQEDEAYWKTMRRACELLQQLDDSDNMHDGSRWEVMITFQRGVAVEQVWMPLTIQRNAETPMVLTATRTQAIAIAPELHVGEPQSIHLREIVKWRRASKGKTNSNQP